MSKAQDIRGLKFGRLTPVELVEPINGKTRWKCICDCGNTVIVNRADMRSGKTQSCGCLQRERARAALHKQLKYRIDGDTAICETNTGVEFYIDAEDVEKVAKRSWYLSQWGYLRSSITGGGSIDLHKYVIGKENECATIDHIDRNKLNNKKTNLRICTPKENRYNKSTRSNNTSGFTGVGWNTRANKWCAYIAKDGETTHLGYFNQYVDAVMARYKAEKEVFGDFAPHTIQDVKAAIAKVVQ